MALRLRIAVHDHVGEKGEELRGPVTPALELEELRRVVDQRRGCLAGAEGLVLDDIFNEWDVRFYPANPELPQRPVHPLEGDRGRTARTP